jgi:thioredoxin reductase (NADPH)
MCDGSFCKEKDVVVVGGGNTAITTAIYLSNIANKVIVCNRS